MCCASFDFIVCSDETAATVVEWYVRGDEARRDGTEGRNVVVLLCAGTARNKS